MISSPCGFCLPTYFHHASVPPPSLSLFLPLLSTDSSLAQAITARTPLSCHIYTTKDRTEQEEITCLKPGSSACTLLPAFNDDYTMCILWFLSISGVFLIIKFSPLHLISGDEQCGQTVFFL